MERSRLGDKKLGDIKFNPTSNGVLEGRTLRGGGADSAPPMFWVALQKYSNVTKYP